jgi:hypothetical protein
VSSRGICFRYPEEGSSLRSAGLRTQTAHKQTKRRRLTDSLPLVSSYMKTVSYKSGRRDLNPRPPEPHSGALPGCATSRLTPSARGKQIADYSRSPTGLQPNRPRSRTRAPFSDSFLQALDRLVGFVSPLSTLTTRKRQADQAHGCIAELVTSFT